MGLFYRRALERDLARWRAQGWISGDGAEAILADVRARGTGFSAVAVFGVLGATLFCFAIAAFVAANWDAISRPVKLALILGVLWSAYGLSAYFHATGRSIAAHCALLLGSSGFGGAIMLIAQMYHLSGHPPDAVLLWALGALIGGAVLQSAPTLTLAAALIAIWSEMEIAWSWREAPGPHWAALPVWAALAFGFWRDGWRGGFHIIAIGLAVWTLLLSFRIGVEAWREPVWGPSLALSLGVMLAGAAAAALPQLPAAFAARASSVVIYGFIVAFLTLFLWRIDATSTLTGLEEIGPYAALVFAFALATLGLALALDDSALLAWCCAAIAGELVYLYLETLGTLLETALFFLLAGLFVALIAALIARRQRRAAARAALEGRA